MKALFTVCLFALLALPGSAAPTDASAPAPANTATTPAGKAVEFPSSPSGTLARQFVAAVNSGSNDAIRAFMNGHLTAGALARMNPEKCERMMLNLRRQSDDGGIQLRKIFASSDTSVQLELQSHGGARRVGLEIESDKTDPTRARRLTLHPMPPPRDRQPKPLPKEKLDAAAALAAIEKHVSETAALDLFSGVVLVAREDQILLHRAWGMAHRDRGLTNRIETRFGSASVGKMFTGVAIAQLVEAGKLKVADTLASILPDYPNRAAAEEITIEQLLTHTAGVGDPFDSPRHNGFHATRQSDWFPLFAGQPLKFKPGERHDYSNGGYVALAAIVEKLSGQLFADYLCDRVFRPAGMRDTGCMAAEDETASIAAPHRRFMAEDPFGIERRQVGELPKLKRTAAGMGGWQTTSEDLFRFARALRTNRLLSPAMTREAVTGRTAVFGEQVKYGYGFYEMKVHGEPAVGHSGGGGDMAVAAECEMLWESGYTVVILSNYDLPETRRLAHVILRFLKEQQP